MKPRQQRGAFFSEPGCVRKKNDPSVRAGASRSLQERFETLRPIDMAGFGYRHVANSSFGCDELPPWWGQPSAAVSDQRCEAHDRKRACHEPCDPTRARRYIN